MSSLGNVDVSSSGLRRSPTGFRLQLSALQLTFLYSCLILIIVQFWRPYFFLADDNLALMLPIIPTMGERLLHGQSPLFDPYIFGGLSLPTDPTFLPFFNPLVLGLSLLGRTSYYLAIIDLIASAYLLAAALCFTLLLMRLREVQGLELSDGRLVFLSLSFTFSAYSLSIGSCWAMYMANLICPSLFTLGFLSQRRAGALALIAGGVLIGIFMGHLSPLLYTLFFFSFFVLAFCWTNQSWQPLQNWCLGLLIGLLIAAPFLVPEAHVFLARPRSSALDVQHLVEDQIPLPALVLGYFSGFIGVVVGGALGLFRLHFLNGVASCAASFQIFGGLPKGRKLSRLEISVGILALLVALFIVRPLWLAAIVAHMPLYRSLRWPFRETYLLLFFVHLWIALRPVTMKPRTYVMTNLAGVALFITSQIAAGPWSFSPRDTDRELLMTEKADAYWQQVRPLLKPGDRLISVIDPIFFDRKPEIPYTLLGAYNFPSLFKVHSLEGFTSAGFRDNHGLAPEELELETGFYSFLGGKRMLARNPHVKALWLVSLDPPTINLCSASGCLPMKVPAYTRVGTARKR